MKNWYVKNLGKGLQTVFFCALFWALPFAANAEAKAEVDMNAVSALQEILEPIQSLQGNFHQKVMNEGGKVMRQSHGQLWLKKPGYFRWEVQGKDKHMVISDGKHIWDYDPELSQVTVQKFPNANGSSPLYFLSGDAKIIGEEFEVTSEKSEQCMKNSNVCFELRPKTKSNAFQMIKIGFQDKELKEIELLDQLGQRSSFIFQKLSMNEKISPAQFRFKLPQGVDVVRH